MSSAANGVNESIDTFLNSMWDQEWGPALEILRANPGLARLTNEANVGYVGTFPLLIACYKKAPRELIEELLRIHPDVSKERDRYGKLALHLLFMESSSVHQYANYDDVSEEVVDALIEANPSAVAAKTNDELEELPLHFAAGNNFASGKAVLKLIAAYPEAASIANQSGDYPLHLICLSLYDPRYERANLYEITAALLEAYPDAVFQKNEDGDLPLYCFVDNCWESMNEKQMRVFRLIFDANRDAAKVRSNEGCLLLHIICCRAPRGPLTKWHMEMFDSLMEANTEAACAPDDDGFLPLHYACREWPISCKDMLAKLMAANPQAIHTPDSEGLTPLDYAMRRETDSAEFVRELFAVSSGGVMLAQLEGMTVELEGMTVAFAGAMARINDLEQSNH